MKSLITPSIALAMLAGAHTLISGQEQSPSVEDYAFNPSKLRRTICGPTGSNRGSLFRPDVARLFSVAAAASSIDGDEVPLLKGLDLRDFPMSSQNAEAKAYFRQGFSLLYGFNHWEAIRAFKKSQALDPTCAICFWGEAIALGPNINAPMTDEAAPLALAAIRTAVALIENADARERALIEAAAKRYSDDVGLNRAQLDAAYADAMAEVYAAYPDDQDIATLYAEALMDTSPWDYWERDFSSPRPHIKTAIDTINKVLAANPDHYGAIHLHIHLYEASVRVQESEVYADRLADLPIASGHLIHMPSHIYFRIGRYLDSLDINIRAAQIDKEYLAQSKSSRLYRFGYYPHNVHFILVSAQMAEDKATSLEYAKVLDEMIPVEQISLADWLPPIKVAPYFAYAQFGDMNDIEALRDPGDDVPFLKAMWHYARGTIFAQAGDDRAWVEQEAIETLIEAEAIQSAGIPAATVLEIAANTVGAKRLMAAGNYDGAIELMQQNVTLQDSLVYLEPPFWYYAVEQTLAAAYYLNGQYREAEQAFKESLVRHPNSAGSLYGLWQTQLKLGLDAEADFTRGLYEQATRSPSELSIAGL